MPPSVRYLNQTAPFWDFVASLEDQASQHPFFSTNPAQAREADNEEEQMQFPWAPYGWGHRGRRGGHGAGRGGRRHEHDHHSPPPPPHERGEEGSMPPPHHDRDEHGPRGHHHGPPPPDASHRRGGPFDGPFEGEATSRSELPIRGSGSPPPPHEHGHERRRGSRSPPHEHGHGHGHGHRSRSPPREGRQGPHGPHRGGRGFGRHGRRGGFEGSRGGCEGFGNMGGPFNMGGLADFFQSQLFGDSNNGTNAKKASTNEDFTPPVDVFDTETAYVVHVSLAGAKKEDVAVSWNAETSDLTISGVIYRPGDEEFLKTLALDERNVGAFERKVRLGSRAYPAKVEADGITAKLEDGILRVQVPKEDKDDFVNIMTVDIE